jgi:cell division protein FtsZ
MTDFQDPSGDVSPDDQLEPRLTFESNFKPGARIKVIGVGGGGSNAVNRMVTAGLESIDFIVANTDAQALAQASAPVRLQLGTRLTKGLGAGADPNIGRQAALEDTEQLIGALAGADMVFVTAGMGGGTGTGAAPVIANLASELGALTVAVVTKPFKFEGKRRDLQATRGLEELQECVDTVITIPNDRLLATIDRTTSLAEAFNRADDVLHQAIRGISDLIVMPGLINLDFADVTTIMSGMGLAIMGTGVGEGENRASDAATRAVSSPLLEEASVEGARAVIVNVTGGSDLSMMEVSEATSIIFEAAHEEANIIFGAVIDPSMQDRVKITVIATGFGQPRAGMQPASASVQTPVDLQNYTEWQSDAHVSRSGGGDVTIARRPVVGLPALPPAHPSHDHDERLELDTSLETPAFLRRPGK